MPHGARTPGEQAGAQAGAQAGLLLSRVSLALDTQARWSARGRPTARRGPVRARWVVACRAERRGLHGGVACPHAESRPALAAYRSQPWTGVGVCATRRQRTWAL